MNKANKPQAHSGAGIVIPVMGATGAGKSSFINMVLGEHRRTVGHEINSCTTDISLSEIPSSKLSDFPLLSGRRVYLADTPGFDDTYKDDVKILQKIAKWLKESYTQRHLGGVIYLHDVSADRYTGTAKRNVQMFNKLCGESESVLERVVIGLTKASRIGLEEARRREDGLKVRQWGHMVAKGVEVLQIAHETSKDDAQKLLALILRKHENHLIVNIQKEMVEKKKIVPETEAGMELRFTLQKIVELQKKHSALSTAPGSIEEAREEIEKLSKQLAALRVPFSRRLLLMLGFRS